MLFSSTSQATEDPSGEQFGGNAATDDTVVEAGPETEAEQPVLAIEASVEGDTVFAASVERKDDDEHDKIADVGVTGVVEDKEVLQAEEGGVVDEAGLASEEHPTAPVAVGHNPVAPVLLSPADGAGEDEMSTTLIDVQTDVEPVAPEDTEPERAVSNSEPLVEGGEAAVPAVATDEEPGAGEAMPISTESTGVGIEKMVKELVTDDAALAGVGTASPADSDTPGSSDGTKALAPIATQLSSAVVDESLIVVELPFTVDVVVSVIHAHGVINSRIHRICRCFLCSIHYP